MIYRLIPLFLVAACILLSGCDKDEIQSYVVPSEGRDQAPAAAATKPAGDHACCAPAWTAPETWQASEPRSMQQALWNLPTEAATPTEVSLTRLGGDGGGNLANVNRWRGQLGLPAVTAEDLPDQLRILKQDPLLHLADLQTETDAMLVGMLHLGDETWYVKLTGPATDVADHRQDFLAFLDTMRLEHQQ